MTPERWQQVKEILSAALDLDADERSAYLSKIEATNPELCREVESLLAHGTVGLGQQMQRFLCRQIAAANVHGQRRHGFVDDKCNGDYCNFRGGAYLTNDPMDRFAACGDVCAGNDKSFKNATVGIRCCRDDAP